MGVEHVRYANTIVHYSVIDAVFRAEDGSPVSMSFHHFCGPSFEDSDGKDVCLDEDDAIWTQFNGWWEAKGRSKYRGDHGTLVPLGIEP